MNEQELLRQTLEHYRTQRQQLLEHLRAKEQMIRQLEIDLGEQPSIEEGSSDSSLSTPTPLVNVRSVSAPIRPDEFYGKSQSDAAKAYLKMVGRAISFDDLVDALQKGGAKLGGADPKKTLYVSLARNPRKEFVWPSKDHIGLSEFYEKRKK